MNVKDFYNHLLDNMIPEDINQESQGVGDKRFTADDWTLEVCKCLMGEQEYGESCYYKIKTQNSLQIVKDEADILCVAEVGRGLDIVISNMVKKWKKVICYDHNPIYDNYLHRYFDEIVEFHNLPTLLFVQEIDKYIKEKCIMIMNHTLFRKFDLLKKNKNIVHLIFNGDLI